MRSILTSVLGGAFLVVGASTAMAQSYGTPAPSPVVEANVAPAPAPIAPAPVSNEPAQSQPVQAEATPVVVASVDASVQTQSSKPKHAGLWCDNSDPYGGHSADSLWGIRSFWEHQAESD